MARHRNKAFLEAIDKQVKGRAGMGEQELAARSLPISSIDPDPEQPRRRIDPKSEGYIALRCSIRRHGVLEPILVSSTKNDRYSLIAGHRRLLAAQDEKKSHIPARIIEAPEDLAQKRLIQLTENIQREDLNPMDIAFCIAKLQDELGYSQTRLGDDLGLSQSAISQYLAISRLDAESLAYIQMSPERYSLRFLRKLSRLSEVERIHAIQSFMKDAVYRPEKSVLEDPGWKPGKKPGSEEKGRWRPRIHFDHKARNFSMVRSRHEDSGVFIEVPKNWSLDEIKEAFQGFTRALAQAHLKGLDGPEPIPELTQDSTQDSSPESKE
jgi:ParB/RepB/Spo0J family partition protein